MRAAYLRLAVLLPSHLGIVALRGWKCVATGDDGKRYCDDPHPTRRGLVDPEKSVVTKVKIRHFRSALVLLLVPIAAPSAVSAANLHRFILLSPRERGTRLGLGPNQR